MLMNVELLIYLMQVNKLIIYNNISKKDLILYARVFDLTHYVIVLINSTGYYHEWFYKD